MVRIDLSLYNLTPILNTENGAGFLKKFISQETSGFTAPIGRLLLELSVYRYLLCRTGLSLILKLKNSVASVGDPDLHVFGPPGSGSLSQRYGSGSSSGSFPFLIKVLSGLK
jgi:hypothetical protein